ESPDVARIRADGGRLLWIWEETDQRENLTWSKMGERLANLGRDGWCDLLLRARLSKPQALAAGQRVADRVTEVYLALLPLYRAVAQRTAMPRGERALANV
ncbi:MAG: hypothetical protein V1772_07705, partial [Chloroflexota bacterium]